MNESKWEPPAEMVEALAKELHEAYRSTNRGCIASWVGASPIAHDGVRAEARFVLRRQHERESLLNGAIAEAACELDHANEQGAHRILLKVMCDYAKLDAPKVPTLADAVEQIERECPGRVIATLKDSQAWTIIKLAAVEREERK